MIKKGTGMGRYYSLNEEGAVTEVSAEEGVKGFEADRQIAQTFLLNGRIRISTVFLVIDHSFVDDSVPVLFETMIFDDEHHFDYQQRYSTRAAALAGHLEALKFVLETL